MKIDVTKVLNAVAVLAAFGGKILADYVDGKKNAELIEKLIDEKLKQK